MRQKRRLDMAIELEYAEFRGAVDDGAVFVRKLVNRDPLRRLLE